MSVRHDVSLIGEHDVHLFNEGTHRRLWRVLGAHARTLDDGTEGTFFGVWAPNAEAVSVVGDFNGWEAGRHPLRPRQESGVWEGFVPGVGPGEPLLKADPLAFAAEEPSATASVVWDLEYEWDDAAWMERRAERNDHRAPVAIYEVHLGSWRRRPDGGWLGYREAGERLARYVTELGFTHVELLPVMEHPYYGSWGYQCTGYFAPTARYGRPQDLMALVDELHRAGIGVILDWVPSHFPADEHALARFDGTRLYEHPDPRLGYHPDWGSLIFNYGRHEVRSFLASSADFWLHHYHADGLRFDAVASMLYLDYSRRPGEWVPNPLGGRENLEVMEFLRQLNTALYDDHPGTQTFAEESTAWPGVSRPVDAGGLGFGFKWDLGWMNDILRYLKFDPVHRKHHHDKLTFRDLYAFSENFVLPLSHDEVVHGKGSLLRKMPGDEWRRFAGLRTLLGYQYAQPGKVLLFMGGEIGEPREWDHESSIDWKLAGEGSRPGAEDAGGWHAGVQRWVRDLNGLMRERSALHRLDSEPAGFEWIEADDADHSVVAFLRHAGKDGPGSGERQDGEREQAEAGDDEAEGGATGHGGHEGEATEHDELEGGGTEHAGPILVVVNFTPVVRQGYRVGVPVAGRWDELLNSDAEAYGGRGVGNLGGVEADTEPRHGHDQSLSLTLPPLGILFLCPSE